MKNILYSLAITTFLFGLTSSCTKPAEACFTFSPTTALINKTVTFDGSCSKRSYALIWNFGDGTADTTIVNSPTVTHTFSSAGSYNVTLTVNRKDGVTFRKGTPAIVQTLTVQ